MMTGLHGFGQQEASAPPPPPEPGGDLGPPGAETQLAAQMIEQRNGKNYWTPEGRKAALDVLSKMRVVHQGGVPETVTLEQLTPAELDALTTPEGQKMLAPFLATNWIDDRVAEGKVVLAPIWIFAPVPGRELFAIPRGDEKRVQDAASNPQVGIISEPKSGMMAGLGTAGLAVGLVVAVGVGYAIYRSQQNRPRRR